MAVAGLNHRGFIETLFCACLTVLPESWDLEENIVASISFSEGTQNCHRDW